ncbi:DUF756 domain-containing protein [Streptomyces clavuligerus]|nr:DUF756 domain-containing protein [Streptomyces clavuligerus]
MRTPPSALPLSVREALARPPRSGGLKAIEHVVLLMQENRSFDHYFGDYPGARGLNDPNLVERRGAKGMTVMDQPSGGDVVSPYALDPSGSEDSATEHHWETGHQAWNQGWYDAWIPAKTEATMGYYPGAGVPVYRELAETFTLCDAYHCSIMSETTSNRNYLFSGYTGQQPDSAYRANDAHAHELEDPDDKKHYAGDAPGYKLAADGKTRWFSYAELLQDGGVSWKVYQEWDNFYDNNLEFFDQFKKVYRDVLARAGKAEAGITHKSLYAFYDDLAGKDTTTQAAWVKALADAAAQLTDPRDKALYERGLFRAQPANPMSTTRGFVRELRADVLSGKLPRVSYIVAPTGDSEHPGNSQPRDGQKIVYQVLDALAADPDVWDSTVLLISYDENDGLFDHMPPPVPPAGEHPDEFVKGNPDQTDGPLGLGIRVPFLVVSPWTRGGYMCSQVFDHTSQIRFLEAWTGVEQPLISNWRKTVAGDLSSVFDFGTATRPPLPAGARRARALPYQPDAYCAAKAAGGDLGLTLANSGGASAHLTVYPCTGTNLLPRHVDVSKGTKSVPVPGGTTGEYRFTVIGPNGFRREFAGTHQGKDAALAVTTSLPAVTHTLTITLTNLGTEALTVQVDDLLDPAPATPHTVEPGKPLVLDRNTDATHGWYDLAITLDGVPAFTRRLAGHLENGGESTAIGPPRP